MDKKEIKLKITPVLLKYGVKRAAIFGSVSRGEERPDSDIDIMVLISRSIGVYEFMKLKFDLEETLGRKVDLVSERSVNKYIAPYIKKDLTIIYER